MPNDNHEELMLISRSLTRLNDDSLLCVVANAMMMASGYEPQRFIRRTSQVMIALSALMRDDDVSARCTEQLRSAADLFERSYIERVKIN